MQAIAAKLLVFGMWGTIGGRSQVPGDNVGYRAGDVAVEALLPSATSELARLHGCQIETLQIAQIDSKVMDHAVWSALADAVLAAYSDPAVVGIVITHGTYPGGNGIFLGTVVSTTQACRADVCHAPGHIKFPRWAAEEETHQTRQ